MSTIADKLRDVRMQLNGVTESPTLAYAREHARKALTNFPDPDAVGRDLAELDELRGWRLAWESGGQPTVDKILAERDEMKQQIRELAAALAKLEEK